MADTFSVVRPGSLDEALGILADAPDDARVVAGGTAVTIMVRRGLIAPTTLVSLQGVPALRTVMREDRQFRIGALVTLRGLELDPLVAQIHPVLPSMLRQVANVRVRHCATIGGNVCEADYASDPPVVLVALDATVRLRSLRGERTVQASDFFRSFFETSIEPDEVLSDVIIPDPAPGSRAVYLKYVSRSEEDRPCVGVAASVRVTPGSTACTHLRVVVGGVSERPESNAALEAQARGQTLTRSTIVELADAYAAAIDPIGDIRGSAWYRTEMIRVFVRRALERSAGLAPQ